MCGVARRAWARNEHSIQTVLEHKVAGDVITLPFLCEDALIEQVVRDNEQGTKTEG